MTYGETYNITLRNSITGKSFRTTATYRYVSWNGYHTDDEGDGLWHNDHQLLGTCQFTVRGCSSEKTAKAKIRNHVRKAE